MENTAKKFAHDYSNQLVAVQREKGTSGVPGLLRRKHRYTNETILFDIKISRKITPLNRD